MKEKATRKWIKEMYGTPIIIPGSICALLADVDADYYCTRVEGWACDLYYIVECDTILCNGYAPFGRDLKKDDYEIVKEYDKKARELMTNSFDYSGNYRQLKRALLVECIIKIKYGKR